MVAIVLGMISTGKASTTASTKTSSSSGIESVTADCQNYSAVIKWNTVIDMGNATFIVERTRDGVHYETVAKVAASTGNTKHEYSVVDESPLNGISYYRISNIDSTGKQVYISTIVYTPCENAEVMDAFNINNNIFLQVNSTNCVSDTSEIVLRDVKGSVILSEKHKISPGLNDMILKPEVEKGVYVLSVKYGKYKLNKVFIIEPAVVKQ